MTHGQHSQSDSDATLAGAPPSLARRDFLRGVGVTLASSSAALAGCTRAPAEKIVPYRVQPEAVRVGEASHYASATCVDGYAVGVLVESHEGRPTKVEGNPEHPASLGACGAFEQASLMDLYSPRRQREVLHQQQAASSAALDAALRDVAGTSGRGDGLHLVMPPTSSPSLLASLGELRTRLPGLHLHFFTALSRMNAWRGAEAALGSVLEPRFELARAKVVLSVDSDFLAHGPARLVLARGFADARRVLSTRDEMNRLYVAEAALSVTGQAADHRLAVRDSALPRLLAELLRQVSAALRIANPALASISAISARGAVPQEYERFVRMVARDLVAHRGAALLLVGDRQPPAVHAAAHALNHLLDAPRAGLVSYAASPVAEAGGASHESVTALSEALAGGAVEALLAFDVDLVEAAPASLRFDSLLRAARSSFFFGCYPNATAARSAWSAPLAHWLESWGDARAFDGTASIVQPLIEPLFGGRSIDDVLAVLLGRAGASAYVRVQAHWRRQLADFPSEWERALARGTIASTRNVPVSEPELRWGWAAELVALTGKPAPPLELSVYADSRTLDGRCGDNAWLVELPDPVTKLCWQNAALLAPSTARRLGLADGDVVALSARTATREVPVLTVPGTAEDTVALSLGWGRTTGLATRGANVCALQSPGAPWIRRVTLRALGRRAELPITQPHQTDEGFGEAVLAFATLERYRSQPGFTARQRKRQLSLYSAETPRADAQWAMAIDLNACIGCGACVIACQAENNIPTVGAEGVMARREMHWLRIDRYVLPDSTVVNEPMACQHCERAPCEYVCPTGASVHSSDGLNQMVYNRCVGTRFCSNNCPYKVRRFNWFNYHADEPHPTPLVHNPEVTVRARGVMEKCTYCVQRIRKAELRARLAGTSHADGSVQTACEQTCATRAIVFGNLADASSRVARLHANERAFEVLNELGTAPRTRYLAKLSNRNGDAT